MSGAFGWGGSSRKSYRDKTRGSDRFSKARSSYQVSTPQTPPKAPQPNGKGSAPVTPVKTSQAPSPASMVWQQPVMSPKRSFNKRPHGKTLTSSAKAVVVVAVDVTGSLKAWVPEIFRRLPLLFKETQKYLGKDLQILFITYGDCKYGDVVEVIDFGSGPELDDHLNALNTDARGGADGEESPEIVAHWLLHSVDFGSAKHVFTFFISDEAGADNMAGYFCKQGVGLDKDVELPLANDTFACLRRKSNVFSVLAKTPSFYDYMDEEADIEGYWERALGKEHVLPLADQRRVVDVMLGAIAKRTQQYDSFTQALATRQGEGKFAKENLASVHASLSMMVEGPSSPPPDPRRKELA